MGIDWSGGGKKEKNTHTSKTIKTGNLGENGWGRRKKGPEASRNRRVGTRRGFRRNDRSRNEKRPNHLKVGFKNVKK